MSTSAREAILGTLREAARPRGAAPVTAPGPHTRPAWTGSPVARLQERLQSRSASVELLDDRAAAIPEAVLRYMAARGLPGRLACAAALQGLPWPVGLLDLHVGAARRDEAVSVTTCLAAVAETGVLMLASGPQTPTTLNFVPEHHLVVVRESQIVGWMEDAWQVLRRHAQAQGAMPRAVNVISGPSRTADVEQTLQLGAHGPRHLHVMIVADGAPAGSRLSETSATATP